MDKKYVVLVTKKTALLFQKIIINFFLQIKSKSPKLLKSSWALT